MSRSFVPYLTLNDYLPSIQDGQLNSQVLDALYAGTRERKFAESWAIGKLKGKLSSEFDLDFEITPTLPFSYSKKYGANDRATIDFPDWISRFEYVAGDLVIHDENGYVCRMDNADVEFDISNWTGIGQQYDIYYIKSPFPIFQIEPEMSNGIYAKGVYKTGDEVWWAGHTYTCIVGTTTIDHAGLIQSPSYSAVPANNIFPNDPNNGKTYWFDNGTYFIEDEIPSLPIDGQDEPKWTLGDNRDPVTLQAIIDISLWKLHSRISPQNIPKLRQENFESAMKWLSNVNSGEENIDIASLQPPQGGSMRWGSKIKQQNGYT